MNKKLFLSIILASLPVSSMADVWCKAGNGATYARPACKKSETQLDLAALGLQGPQGLQGIAGKDAVIPVGCPDSLDGMWSGSSVESSDGTVNDPVTGDHSNTHQVVNTVSVLKISGATAQPLYIANASSGIFGSSNGGPAVPQTIPVVFDKATCSGKFGSDATGGVFYFVVSEGGRTIQSIGNKNDSGTFAGLKFASGTAKMGTFHKQ